MNYFVYVFAAFIINKKGQIKYPKRSTFDDKIYDLKNLIEKRIFKKSTGKSINQNTVEYIFLFGIILLSALAYNVSKLFWDGDGPRYLFTIIIPVLVIDYWGFKLQKRCPKCKSQEFSCQLDSHNTETTFYDVYHGIDKITKKSVSNISKDEINSSKYENVWKQVKSDKKHYYNWNCKRCNYNIVFENDTMQLSIVLIVLTLFLVFAIFNS